MVYAATVDASSLPALPALHKAYDDRVFSVVIERVAAGTVPRHEVEKYHFHIVNALLHRARVIEYRAIGPVPEWAMEVVDELDPSRS
ncbi:hypothetical protein TDMWS_17490 [Thermodesulfomicrobium sp. WS]|nr:hypothetical protein TDMWS_17490 [Thermodesulfomicrobium sp. WS]